jgi:hypothetical protein
MIVFVPIMFFMPAMLVFIPPAMMLTPTPFASFVQFPSFMLRLPAVTPMALNGLMQFMFGMHNAPLTLLHCLGMRAREGNAESESHTHRSG